MNNSLLNSTHCTPQSSASTLIAATLEDPVNPYHSQTSDNDPLVAHGWQNAAYVGVLVLAICLIVAVRVFSKTLDNAIIFALVLTLVAILAFMLVTH
jgi:hypothetical protein